MKKHQWLHIGVCFLIALLLPLSLFAETDTLSHQYTEENPLVYEDAWNLWPYCYLNEHGEPEGYSVDLVRMLCEEMNIPYVIRLRSTHEALRDLKEGRSDLMLGLDNRYEQSGLLCSKNVIQMFTHSVVYPKDKAVHVRTVSDLSRQEVIVHTGSFCHHLMETYKWDDNAVPVYDMKAAIMKLSAEGEGQIVWNTMSLKWLLRKFQMDDLVIEPVDVPHGYYRFMSHDSVLLNRIDAAYVKLAQNRDVLESLQNRWFYPDKVDSGIPAWVWYATGIISFVALALILLYFFYRHRERKMTSLIRQNTRLLAHILKTSNMALWTYDTHTHSFAWLNMERQTERKCSTMEFSRNFDHADFEKLCEELEQLDMSEKERATLELRSAPNRDVNGGQRVYSVVLSVLRRKAGKPSVILGTMSDQTEDRERQHHAAVLLSRYKSVFETAMVDMVYYNQDGYISNINKRAMRTFRMTKEQAVKAHIHLSQIIGDDGVDLSTFENYHVTRVMNTYNQFIPEKEPGNKKIYYELQLVAVRDKCQKLLGVYGTGMEVTDFVRNWRQQKENIQQLRCANQEMEAFVRDIDYVMKVGGVRIINYSPQTHTLTFFNEINVSQHTMTQSRCIALVADSSKKLALRLLSQMDNFSTAPIECEILTNIHLHGNPISLQVSLIPLYDSAGRVTSYFGMCRDITEIKITEQQLEKESERAKGIEELKNSFLRHMSYEIRIPLSTVVGFAELFEQEHQQEDEEIFVREIKDNAAYLLKLINEILFLSRLDAHMIEINKQPTDFAKTFESHCYTGWANDQKPGVRYQVFNHFEQLVVNIDDANLGRIINQLVANAAQHTTSGTVRTRYDYVDGKLMIGVEDTGSGISDEDMKHLYERFSSGIGGTGLGLPISRELAIQMGGNLEISSKVGNGTTVWVIIPCELLTMERKMEDFMTS